MTNHAPNSAVSRLRTRLMAGASISHELPREVPFDAAAPFPLSSAQERMLVLDRLSGKALSYNLPLTFELSGDLDIPRLSHAVRDLGRRHESLRTSFGFDDDARPIQRVLPDVDLVLEQISSTLLQTLPSTQFDLNRPPLARFRLVRVAESLHILHCEVHHIIADGFSIQLLMRDLLALYAEQELAPLGFQYRDFVHWQLQWLKTPHAQVQGEFWSRMFEDAMPQAELPTDFARPREKNFQGGRVGVTLTSSLAEGIRGLARVHGATPFLILLGGLSILLGKLSGQHDVVVGASHAGRNQPMTREIVGLFVNTLLYRSRTSPELSVSAYLRQLHRRAIEILDNADYPFDQLVARLDSERRPGENPLFNVMMTYQNLPSLMSNGDSIKVKARHVELNVSNFDLEFYASDQSNGIELVVEYSTQLFTRSSAEEILGMLSELLRQMIQEPEGRIGELRLHQRDDEFKILRNLAGPVRERSADSVVDLFRRAAIQHPNRVAAVCEGQSLTYAELDFASSVAASRLVEEGIQPESLVALLMERGLTVLICMLGVLKSGAAFIPIDTDLPAARVETILLDSGAGLVVVDGAVSDSGFVSLVAKKLILSVPALMSGSISASLPEGGVCPRSLAYVIYTSGSTGRPKGAMVEHEGFLNHIESKIDVLGLDENDVIAQTATISFDIAVWQFLAAVCVGGRTVVLPGDSARDPAKLASAVATEGLTVLELVPSHFEHWLDRLESAHSAHLHPLRWLMLTGEALPAALCSRWFSLDTGVPLVNAYGPTECSDDVTHCVLRGEDDLPFATGPVHGTIRNTRLYVLSSELQHIALGAIGELYVGGVCVGRGYLGDSVRTATAFLPDVFATSPGQRMYRTGDHVRLTRHGELEYLGRIDDQVKLRGYRIQLGEVEAALLSQPGCRAAIAMVTADGQHGGRSLTAYVVGNVASPDTLSQALRSVLPVYMVPANIIVLEKLPLLPNGKVNRRALPPPVSQVNANFIPPRTLLEQRILGLWKKIIDPTLLSGSVQENFFDVGGDSLRAMRLASLINSEFNTSISFGAVLANPTVEGLAGQVDVAGGALSVEARVNDLRPTTFVQRKILTDARFDSTVLNMPVVLAVKGNFDLTRVSNCLIELSARHEMLRSRFSSDGLAWWVSDDPPNITIRSSEYKNVDEALHAFVQPFNLAVEAPFRAQILHGEINAIIVDFHSVATDALSKLQLLKEFCTLYEGGLLSRSEVDFADYVRLEDAKNSRIEMREVWLAHLPEKISHLKTWQNSFYGESLRKGTRHSAKITPKNLQQLEKIGSDLGVTLHSVVFAAAGLGVAEHFKHLNDYVGICPVADRDGPGMQGVIGLLIQNMPIHLALHEGQTLLELVQSVHRELVWTYSNVTSHAAQVFSERTVTSISDGQTPLEPIFVWIDEREETTGGALDFSLTPPLRPFVPFDLRIEMHLQVDGLEVVVEGREQVFSSAELKEILLEITAVCSRMLDGPLASTQVWQ